MAGRRAQPRRKVRTLEPEPLESHNSPTEVAGARALAERVVSCARLLSTGVAGGFTGAYLGPYASSSGGEGGAVADFAWFEYRGTEPPTHPKL